MWHFTSWKYEAISVASTTKIFRQFVTAPKHCAQCKKCVCVCLKFEVQTHTNRKVASIRSLTNNLKCKDAWKILIIFYSIVKNTFKETRGERSLSFIRGLHDCILYSQLFFLSFHHVPVDIFLLLLKSFLFQSFLVSCLELELQSSHQTAQKETK